MGRKVFCSSKVKRYARRRWQLQKYRFICEQLCARLTCLNVLERKSVVDKIPPVLQLHTTDMPASRRVPDQFTPPSPHLKGYWNLTPSGSTAGITVAGRCRGFTFPTGDKQF